MEGTTGRQKSNTLTQINKVLPVPIELDDHTKNQRLLASSQITDVLVGDYFLVSGEGGPSYVVWCIKITLNESLYSSILIYKRYSDIENFRNILLKQYPEVEIPPLPPKNTFSIERLLFSRSWLENRRRGLQWFMNYVLLNPKFQHSPVVNDFLLL